ncbi:MAG TPA: alanine racemase [Shinella sp.]|jgi:alanine racemase|uniref:alanine racemase n=1 Tax=Shinella sp. TaxID=1870904 RepID=UPI002E0E88DB|nr:alanine racemase [Shinella sp.]
MTAHLAPFIESYDLGCAEAALLRGSWYEIDLGAIRHNYRQLRSLLPQNVSIYACLKRNAYGCGAGPVARALAAEGVDGFAVASLLDAMAIRRMGAEQRILLYPGALPAAGLMIEALDLTVSVSSIDELERWRAAMTKTRVFIKVDLGFFRAGASPQDAGPLLAAANAYSDVQVDGIYAHMSELPTSTSYDVGFQLHRMRAILAEAEVCGDRPVVAMMSSTEGVLTYPEMDMDAVDPGALFVGLPESHTPVRRVVLQQALKTICTTIVAVKHLDASLGPIPDLPGFRSGMKLGVLGMGWGDGLPRQVPPGAEALVGGTRARLLPPAHLEHVRIDLSNAPDARFGDKVVLLGKQSDEVITHGEIAALWGTDVVGIYAGLRDHIPRIYT